MSNAYLTKQWNDAHQQLLDQIEYETPKDVVMTPKDRETAFQHLAVLYIKYIQAFRKLEKAYDQLVHPQKRRLLKEILVGVMGRVMELKSKIVEVELSDVSNYAEILLDLKLVPDDIALPIPRFVLEEREKELAERKALLETLGARPSSMGDTNPIFPVISVNDAIKMLQINERGRQGRLRAKYMRDIKIQAQREKDLDAGDDEGELNSAALKIQRVFRGHRARKLAKARLREELIFLGMASAPKDPKQSAIAKAELNRNRRKILQVQHEEEYQAALVNTREKIFKVEGPDMKENMQDNFRQWYMEYKRVHGKFPDFPEDSVWQQPGFQIGITDDGKLAAPAEGGAAKEEKAATPGKGKGKKEEKAKGGAKGKGKKGDDAEEEGPKFKYDDSKHLTTIKTECGVYTNQWQHKDDTDNFAQKHDQEIVKNDKRKEVEAEIKKEVYEILKEELVNLKLAVDRSKNAKKGKKGKKDKKGKKGGKKGKGKKDKKGGKKGKKEKDLTANRTMESLIEELIQTGILQKPTEVKIADIKGEYDLLSPTVTKVPTLIPTIAEIKRILTEYCVLPSGFPTPSEVPGCTSVLLFGPHGSGKTMMVNAVATEAGAHLFNLTPRNTAGQYVGKANVTKMVHMVFKVAKANPPAIIYIDNVEMIFAKKVPKDDTTDPKRIKKDLLKQMKGLKTEDRVIVMATSYKPWDGEAKALMPVWSKILYTPKPDYGSRFSIWREFISRKAGAPQARDINFSLLARMSDGLSAGGLHLASERVLTDRRLKLMRTRKLTTNEFIDQIVSLPPADPSEDAEYKEWFEKTPLVKKRIAALTAPADGEEEGKKKDKKKKK
ncbi:Dynein regulatory complex protein 11 [Chytriomyces hyalinus]|nr:Dynein regulatory complex protein 11 [Chytriomyces hyalinus]KAJ3257858.1 Dynein regulatory complex protein 11 [Chytriomyces hyalinus]